MTFRIRLAGSSRLLPWLVLGWRLGLGPLLGRPWCLITASTDGETLVRAAVPYVFAAGDILVPVVGDPSWTTAAAAKPQVTVQAAPGPLATRARPVTNEERSRLLTILPETAPDLDALRYHDWWILQPTGDPGPPPALPDLPWVWIVLAGFVVLLRRRRR